MKKFRVLSMVLMLAFLAVLFSTSNAQVEKKIMVKKIGTKCSLGVAITDVAPDVLQKRNLAGGAMIHKVLKNSEAEKIGLQKEDIILSFDGKEVKDAAQLRDLASEVKEEKSVEIVVLRNEEKKSFKATLKKSEPEESLADVAEQEIAIGIYEPDSKNKMVVVKAGEALPSAKGGFLGVQAKDLNQDLLEYFEVKNGVLVEHVVKDSPAEQAGIKAGDVITQISGKKIEDFDDLIRTMNYYDPKDKIKVEFSRKGKKNAVEVILGEKQKNVQVIKEHLEKSDDEPGVFLWKSDDGKTHKKIKIKSDAPHVELDDLDIDVKDVGVEIYII